VKLGRLNTRQVVLLGVVGVLLLFAVRWRSSSIRSAPPPPGVASDSLAADAAPARTPRGGAGARKPVSADEVPSISKEDLRPRAPRSGSGERDLFDLREPTQTPAPTATPAPPPPPEPGDPRYVGPLPPPPPTPTPAPPAIPFKFIGSFGPRERPIAVLGAGDRLVNARAGDKVFDQFILRRVGFESIDVGFVGFPDAEVRRIGIEK
jgi:hypothetical protein